MACKHCHRLFSSHDSLVEHLKLHGVRVKEKSGEEFICSLCGVTFKSKQSLLGHERSHNKERPFACTICDARFTLKTRLKRHLQTHGGDKPHACDVCPKRFLRAYDLTVHKRVHTKERPYVCETCGRGFAAQTNFRKHVKTCDGEPSVPRKRRTQKSVAEQL